MSHPLITTITKYSHHFTIRNPTRNILPLVYKLSANYTQFGMEFDRVTRRKQWRPLKTFGIYVDHGREFRFHIGQLPELMDALNRAYIEPSSYEIIETQLYEGDSIDIKLQPQWKLYPEQEEAKDFIVNSHEIENNSPMIMIATGGGKTVVAMSAVAELGKRFAVRVQAQYVDKWISDITSILNIEPSEICVIQGSDALMRATNYPGSGLPMPKAFVISIATMSKWYKLYEEDMNNPLLEAYACMPYDFCQHLGLGVEVYDEVHQHPHAVYRGYTYTHIPKTISLSATLLSKDPTLKKVQSMMFPRFKRFDKIRMEKYITIHACAYQVVDFARSKLRTTEWGQNTYSHTAFEKSILSHKTIRKQYLTMISDLADEAYKQIKVGNDKLLIFVASKIMAIAVVQHLKNKWPNLDIRKYMQEDDYKDILEPDICVTTVLSGGTAIDIPGLRATIQTINLDSPIANVQSLGRLRKIKHRDHDNDVHFYYLYCSTIPKHVEYHENRKELFADRALEQKQRFLKTIYP